jgi:hypothetical protein
MWSEMNLVEAMHCKHVRLDVDVMNAKAWAGEAKSGVAHIFPNTDHVLVQPAAENDKAETTVVRMRRSVEERRVRDKEKKDGERGGHYRHIKMKLNSVTTAKSTNRKMPSIRILFVQSTWGPSGHSGLSSSTNS